MSNPDDDTLPGVPVQPPTIPLMPAVSPVEIAISQLARSVELGFREMRVDTQLLKNDFGLMKERIGSVESWRSEQEARATRTSTRVQQNSQADLEQAAQLGLALAALAEEKAKRESLEAVVVTKADVANVVSEATTLQTTALLTGLGQNKKLQVIGGMVLTLVIGYLGRIATAAPAPPSQVVQQVAPTVIYADGGAP